MMRFRMLGRTGLSVSECTIGTAALKASDVDRAEASAMIGLAFDRGINAVEIDAGDREAVDLLGEVLKREGGRHAHVFSRATSLVRLDLPSPHVFAGQAYSGAHLRAETERLLRSLGVERLALQQLHAWCPEWLHEGDWRETLAQLRAEGKIAGIGISLFDHDLDSGLEAVASGAIDAVQVMYNIFDPGAAAALLPLCERHGVGVIARSPLYYGALASPGGCDFPADDWRNDYFYEGHRRETAERVARLALDHRVSDVALRFALSHPAVSTVAVGMRTRTHLEANLAAFERGSLDADTRASLARHAWLC